MAQQVMRSESGSTCGKHSILVSNTQCSTIGSTTHIHNSRYGCTTTSGEPGDDQQLKFNLLVVSTNSTLNGRYVAPMISTLFPEQEFWAFADYAPSFNLVDERLTYNNDAGMGRSNDWTKGKPPLPALQFQSDNSSTGFGWNDQLAFLTT